MHHQLTTNQHLNILRLSERGEGKKIENIDRQKKPNTTKQTDSDKRRKEQSKAQAPRIERGQRLQRVCYSSGGSVNCTTGTVLSLRADVANSELSADVTGTSRAVSDSLPSPPPTLILALALALAAAATADGDRSNAGRALPLSVLPRLSLGEMTSCDGTVRVGVEAIGVTPALAIGVVIESDVP